MAALVVMGGAATLFAQGGPKPAEGMLMLQDKNYPLTHALAYETTINEEELIAVVLSGQAISSEKLKEAIEKEKDGEYPDFKRPYIKLEFTKAGELKLWSASAGNTSLGRRRGNATGELKLQDGRYETWIPVTKFKHGKWKVKWKKYHRPSGDEGSDEDGQANSVYGWRGYNED